MTAVPAILLACLLLACGGKLPETRYYELAPAPVANTQSTSDLVLVLEPLSTDAAYDDERIVYRTNAYRFDYYQYHRWSAAPGTLVGNYLERAFERTGRFRAVVRELDPSAPVILGGRVIAIEEVDDAKDRWRGHLVLELTLTDARSGEVVWSDQYEEYEPLPAQTPEGLARALSTALARIADRAAPVVAEHAERTAARQQRGKGPTAIGHR